VAETFEHPAEAVESAPAATESSAAVTTGSSSGRPERTFRREGRGDGRGEGRGGEGRGEGRGGGRDFRSRRKVCAFCVDKSRVIDYKDASRLRRFLSDRAKIEPRRKTGVCAKHQRRLSTALKRARFLALLPYTGVHLRNSERSA